MDPPFHDKKIIALALSLPLVFPPIIYCTPRTLRENKEKARVGPAQEFVPPAWSCGFGAEQEPVARGGADEDARDGGHHHLSEHEVGRHHGRSNVFGSDSDGGRRELHRPDDDDRGGGHPHRRFL